MSLADELLADLEEAAEEEEGGSYGEEEEEPAIEDVQEEMQLDLSGDSVKSIAKLWDSKMVSGQGWVPGKELLGSVESSVLTPSSYLPAQFAEIMMKIEEYISKQAKASEGTDCVLPEGALHRVLLQVPAPPASTTSLDPFPTLKFDDLCPHPDPELSPTLTLALPPTYFGPGLVSDPMDAERGDSLTSASSFFSTGATVAVFGRCCWTKHPKVQPFPLLPWCPLSGPHGWVLRPGPTF